MLLPQENKYFGSFNEILSIFINALYFYTTSYSTCNKILYLLGEQLYSQEKIQLPLINESFLLIAFMSYSVKKHTRRLQNQKQKQQYFFQALKTTIRQLSLVEVKRYVVFQVQY